MNDDLMAKQMPYTASCGPVNPLMGQVKRRHADCPAGAAAVPRMAESGRRGVRLGGGGASAKGGIWENQCSRAGGNPVAKQAGRQWH